MDVDTDNHIRSTNIEYDRESNRYIVTLAYTHNGFHWIQDASFMVKSDAEQAIRMLERLYEKVT